MQMLRDTRHPGLAPSDRIALVGLAGIGLSIATWFLFAATDMLLGQSPTLLRAVFEPSESQGLVRLAIVVLVLLGTLIIQILSGQRFKIEQRLIVERERLQQMYEHSPESIVSMNPELSVIYANPAANRLFARQGQEGTLLGRPCQALWAHTESCDGCLAEEVEASGKVSSRVAKVLVAGEEHWFEQTVYPAFDESGALESLVEVSRDVTANVNAQRTIERMAYHDSLTDLPNRLLFRDRLVSALSQARRRHETVAIAYVDLDDFKNINDGLGHAVGDGVLQIVAERLQSLLRDEDTVARQSGDEFTIVARIAQREDADMLAERIADAIRPDMTVEGHLLNVSASIGIATYPHDGDNEADLLRCADAAMYNAKEAGTGTYRLFTPEMSELAADRLVLEADLRQAIANREFELFYQPQIDLRTGRAIGLEALIRWNHPTRGLLAPAEFIEFAEQSGFMSQIGPWVVRTACAQMRDWLDSGLDVGRVAVNLSAKEFVQYDVVQTVAEILAQTGLDPVRLELEITETTAMFSADHVVRTLRALRDVGVRVAIDDFGTGYSSMSYLKHFPVQTLKIAQTFMRDVHADPQSAAIASMLINLSCELGLDIVAEGVEHASELEFLRHRGCFVIQGFIYSPPVPAGEIRELLSRDLIPAG